MQVCHDDVVCINLAPDPDPVVVNGSLFDVISGVPQGTVLGSLLFLLYINDITGSIQSNSRLFADDCIVYCTIRSQDDSCKLQNDISSLLKWAETWQIRFNSKKCHILSISHQRNKSSPVYYLGTDVLSTVSSDTYQLCHLIWNGMNTFLIYALRQLGLLTLWGVIHIVVLRKLKIWSSLKPARPGRGTQKLPYIAPLQLSLINFLFTVPVQWPGMIDSASSDFTVCIKGPNIGSF